MTIATIVLITRHIEWVGVGNVHASVLLLEGSERGRREHVMTQGGIIGHHLPPIRPSQITYDCALQFVFGTDGLSSYFWDGLAPTESVEDTAEHIISMYAKDTDDALVLVARYAEQADEQTVS